MPKRQTRPYILAIASGGGHWQQLMALRPAFEGCDVLFATTLRGLAEEAGVSARLVPDCNRNEKFRALLSALAVGWLVVRLRPSAIVTTGALPGYFAMIAGKLVRAKTMWIDSVANAEDLSMAGRLARRHADRWLTQWPSVAQKTGAEYHGAVL